MEQAGGTDEAVSCLGLCMGGGALPSRGGRATAQERAASRAGSTAGLVCSSKAGPSGHLAVTRGSDCSGKQSAHDQRQAHCFCYGSRAHVGRAVARNVSGAVGSRGGEGFCGATAEVVVERRAAAARVTEAELQAVAAEEEA